MYKIMGVGGRGPPSFSSRYFQRLFGYQDVIMNEKYPKVPNKYENHFLQNRSEWKLCKKFI
mgnify:CR=1 FL=1